MAFDAVNFMHTAGGPGMNKGIAAAGLAANNVRILNGGPITNRVLSKSTKPLTSGHVMGLAIVAGIAAAVYFL
jgi:hypothetical protein